MPRAAISLDRLLDYAMSVSRVRETITGDIVLDMRRKQRGIQDDPAAASVLAVGHAYLLDARPEIVFL